MSNSFKKTKGVIYKQLSSLVGCLSPSFGASTILHTGNFKKKVTGLQETMNGGKGMELRDYQMSKANCYVTVCKCGCFNRQIDRL